MKQLIAYALTLALILTFFCMPARAQTDGVNVIEYYEGGVLLSTQELKAGTTNEMINYVPEREGEFFAGWYYDPDLTQSINNFTEDSKRYGRLYFDETTGNCIKLYAKMVPSVPLAQVTTTFGSQMICHTEYGNLTGFLYGGKYYTRIGMNQNATMTFDTDHLNIDSPDQSNKWGTVWVLNPDGTVFRPKPNTKYTVTMAYSNPTQGDLEGYPQYNSFRVVAGLSYADAALINYADRHLDSSTQYSSDYESRRTYPASETVTTITSTLTTPSFEGYLPCIGLMISVSGSGNKGLKNDFNLYSVTVTESGGDQLTDAELTNAGASVLTEAAAEQTGSQALRSYCTYRANNAGCVAVNGRLYRVVARGALVKRADKKTDLVLENAGRGGVIRLESTKMNACWNWCVNGDNTFDCKFSTYIAGITDEYMEKDVTLRYYLRLEDGRVLYADEISYNAKTVADEAPAETLQTAGGRQLVWHQEFSSCTGISDTSNLKYHYAMQDPDVRIVNDESCVSVKDGILTMVTRLSDDEAYIADMPSMGTNNTMNFRYGYVEMRAKVPFQRGAWPSFWMQSTNYRRKADYMSEIDIFEVFGSRKKTRTLETTLHKWGDNGAHAQKGSLEYAFDSTEEAGEWHIYAFDWTPYAIRLYVDGVCIGTVDITDAGEFSEDFTGMQGFHDFHCLLLNNFIFTPSQEFQNSQAFTRETMTDIYYSVDYIRLYQNNDTEIMITYEK